jgi:choline-sulfatase
VEHSKHSESPERVSQSSGGWALRWRRLEPLRRRLLLGMVAGSLMACLLAMADALWTRAGVAAAIPAVELFVALWGLLVPLGLAVGLAVGVLSWLIHPRAEPSLASYATRIREAAAGRPADIAAVLPLSLVGLFVWATASAQLARIVLSIEASAFAVALCLSLGSLLLAAGLSLVVLAVTPWLRKQLARAYGTVPGCVDPVVSLMVACGLVALVVLFGAYSGDVSGNGGFFGIYGILRRQELDLRLPFGLLLLSASAFLLPWRLRGLSTVPALLLSLVPLLLTMRSAVSLNDHADMARLIERSAPLSSRPLKSFRRLSDRDGDGASGFFGGGDCNDASPQIGPGAKEIPGNGIDEDCSGGDLSLAALKQAKQKPAPTKTEGANQVQAGNVVLITIDTLRYDLGYMGYKRAVSPNLDKLAKRSTVFERAYSLASYTGKSVGPMLIGKLGSETHRNWGHFNKFGEKDTFVAERLKRAGFQTASIHGHRYFGNWGGLERGFDAIDMRAAPPKDAKWASDSTVTSEKLTTAAIEHLKGFKGKFFLWVHYLDPHADYKQHGPQFRFGSKARDLYDGEVAYTDSQIGRLLDFIEAQSFGSKTSIIVTSDHGEAFGEHKMYRHGFELWEELVRVPLIVHVPGAKANRVKARRSLIDVVPTLLELTGVQAPPHRSQAKADSDDFVSGYSLVSDVYAKGPEEIQKRDVIVDMPAGPYNESRRAFIHNDLKLVISRGASKELFDLAKDPRERRNVWYTRRKEIEARYAAARTELREIVVKGKRK